MNQVYNVTGMTCSSCEEKVKRSLLALPSVSGVTLNRLSNSATITMTEPVSLSVLQEALGEKYQISTLTVNEQIDESRSFFDTYRPVLLLFGYIFLVAMITSWQQNQIDWLLFMRFFMSGFFLAFSFFKLINLDGFAESYSMYDIVAKKFKSWGYIYAFLELGLGIAFLIDFNPRLTNTVTLVVMSASSIGVLQSLLNKRKIKCACLGAVFNLPMSTLTVIEDLLMIVMSGVMLILM